MWALRTSSREEVSYLSSGGRNPAAFRASCAASGISSNCADKPCTSLLFPVFFGLGLCTFGVLRSLVCDPARGGLLGGEKPCPVHDRLQALHAGVFVILSFHIQLPHLHAMYFWEGILPFARFPWLLAAGRLRAASISCSSELSTEVDSSESRSAGIDVTCLWQEVFCSLLDSKLAK